MLDYLRNIFIIQKYPTLKQMIKFALVGVFNTVVDFSIYFGLTRSFLFWQKNYLGANFIAFSTAVTFSYFVNRRWTFRNKHQQVRIQYFKFFMVCGVGLILTEFILFALVDLFEIYDVLAKITAVFIIYFWNFGANKFWTFKES